MNKERVIKEYKNIVSKIAEFSVKSGKFKDVQSNWTVDDLRKIINRLEDSSQWNVQFFRKVNGCKDRYTGKGEVLLGYLDHGVITQKEFIGFKNAQNNLLYSLAKINNIKGYSKGYLSHNGEWIENGEW